MWIDVKMKLSLLKPSYVFHIWFCQTQTGTFPRQFFFLGVVISWYRKWTVMWLTWASHFLWLTPESPQGSECDSSCQKGGKYWINCNYLVWHWMKSELGCYKDTKAQTFQNHSDTMTVMTHSTHMVVVFLLCHVAYRLNVSSCTFDIKLQFYTS